MRVIALDDVIAVIKKHSVSYRECVECGGEDEYGPHTAFEDCGECTMPSEHHKYNPRINVIVFDLMEKARDE